MILVIFIVLIVTIILLMVFFYNSNDSKNLILEKEQILSIQMDKLKIAEKKFFQGKIRKPIFDKLKNDLEYNIILTELDLFRLKKTPLLKLEEKAQQLFFKLKKPTKYKKAKLKKLLKESELIRSELNIIEKKLLKNNISQETFERLIREKENEIIEKETQIIYFMKNQESQIE
ncbi:MAG: hypothetical protein PHP82_02315 [Candidatus ainarchaeum sp.]|nr:hypothetical protein [Candidatus ainarchaeum sp.]